MGNEKELNKKELDKQMLRFLEMTIKNPSFFKLSYNEQIEIAKSFIRGDYSVLNKIIQEKKSC